MESGAAAFMFVLARGARWVDIIRGRRCMGNETLRHFDCSRQQAAHPPTAYNTSLSRVLSKFLMRRDAFFRLTAASAA